MDPRTIINDRLKTTSQTELAKELGVSQAYIGEVSRGTRCAGPKLLKAMGLVQTKVYNFVGAPDARS